MNSTTPNTPSAESIELSSEQKPDNGLVNIIFNIVIPVLILNKFSGQMGHNGPVIALFLALSFPVGYFFYDFLKKQKKNYLSIFGLVNVLVTGILAIIGLQGIWFSVKEAFFPALIGIFVLGSAFTKKPIIESLLMNPTVMNLKLIQSKLDVLEAHFHFRRHLRNATLLLAISFFISAVLNFVIAERIFININPQLDETARAMILNEQIAEMTYKSMLIITLPSFISLLGILWFLVHGIKKHTGLKTSEIFVDK